MQLIWGNFITIEQPGMYIRITRFYSRRKKVFYDWFDTWVLLTSKPKWPLGGILGDTFPQVSASAAGGGQQQELIGGFVMPEE